MTNTFLLAEVITWLMGVLSLCVFGRFDLAALAQPHLGSWFVCFNS
jgi:hypothetical protein